MLEDLKRDLELCKVFDAPLERWMIVYKIKDKWHTIREIKNQKPRPRIYVGIFEDIHETAVDLTNSTKQLHKVIPA